MNVDTEGKPALLAGIEKEVLSQNVSRILQELQAHHLDGERPAKLIAVTKTAAPDVINSLLALGVRDIAENRAQVAIPKLCYLEPSYRLHWIGRLQTNKVKAVLPHICMLHSLDRMELAQEVNRRAGESSRVLPALVQVNVAGESQKAGVSPQDLIPFLRQLKDFSSLSICGLMTIMPIDADAESLKVLFHRTRQLFDEVCGEAIDGIQMRELSMGMSRDYLYAAQAGATMVRIGTALYQTHG